MGSSLKQNVWLFGIDTRMKIAVNIPAFNEEQQIGLVIKRIPRTMIEANEVLVLVVDDGSVDSTAENAKLAGADYILRHQSNLGVAHAFQSGIGRALDLDVDIIVNIDGDGQFDPEEIPNLIAPIIDDECDIALGSRFLDRNNLRIPISKRLGNRIISLIVSTLTGHRIRDTQCGFRALSKRAAENLVVSGIFTYTQEMILDLSFRRFRLREVPISVRYFPERESRVVKSMSRYAFKALGVLLIALVRHFARRAAVFIIASVLFAIILLPFLNG